MAALIDPHSLSSVLPDPDPRTFQLHLKPSQDADASNPVRTLEQPESCPILVRSAT